MIRITFNAFSFLQKKLRKKNIEPFNPDLKIKPGTTIDQLILDLHLKKDDVEAVFVNSRVEIDFDRILKDQDRVALVPPGIPGPYRVMLGFINKK
ncbi:MAG: thiamine biosynthesis protein ThiS [Bacteroidetes bacterium]|jgi:molybdopterin converting factor small subunit|nr:thiamine biosynthesis protein ThiS [Bacteroidota bacterium]